MKHSCMAALLAGVASVTINLPATAQEQASSDVGTLDQGAAEKLFPKKRAYSPYAGRNFPSRPFFGDTHLHTSFSFDAGAFGARLGPVDAYRFAKGEQVVASSGQPAKLSRPLDFLVVADHSDNMGFFPDLLAAKPNIMADPTGRKWHDMIVGGQGADAAIEIIVAFSQNKFPKALLYSPDSSSYRSAWQETIRAAEQANEPGRFTAFIGYEWTSNTGGNNLHRNVIFRDNGDKASRVVPYTVLAPSGSDNPRDLWKWMAAYEDKTGGRVLAIAHNGNLSNGRMFPISRVRGPASAIDRDYAETRAKWERLYEATQIKGDGETHPYLSPNDEFANFERWDKGNLDLSEAKTPDMLQHEYARSGAQARPQVGRRTWRQSVQVRFGRLDRFAYWPGGGRGGQLLRQDLGNGAERGPEQQGIRQGQGRDDLRVGDVVIRLCGGLGDREHARGALRRDGAPRDLRDDRLAHAGALLRRLRIRRGRCEDPKPGGRRLHEGRADGRRPRRRHRPARRRHSSSRR